MGKGTARAQAIGRRFAKDVRKAFVGVAATFAPIWRRAAVVFQVVVGTLVILYATGTMLFDPPNVALRLAGGAGLVALAFASCAFSYSRTEVHPAMRGEITFAGARFLQSSTMFLVASLMKYGSEATPRHVGALMKRLGSVPPLPRDADLLDIVPLLFNGMAFLFAVFAAFEFQSGLLRLSGIAAHKSQRSAHVGHFFTAEAYSKSLDLVIAGDGDATTVSGVTTTSRGDGVPDAKE
jgi:hypothetical protein